mgnify:CR=1 FL=1
MRANKFILMASTAFATSISVAQADISVVASIKPVHSLVAGVMEGIGTPNIIVDGAGSPHSYSLKPSQARELQDADAVFWFGHGLETFLEKPLEAISTNAKVVELIDTDGLLKLKFREGGPFSEHDHDDDHTHLHGSHDHDDEDDDHHDQRHPLLTLFPFFRPKSFVIGLIHGMAGSAAVMLAILPTTPSIFTGILFLITYSINFDGSRAFSSCVCLPNFTNAL